MTTVLVTVKKIKHDADIELGDLQKSQPVHFIIREVTSESV